MLTKGHIQVQPKQRDAQDGAEYSENKVYDTCKVSNDDWADGCGAKKAAVEQYARDARGSG